MANSKKTKSAAEKAAAAKKSAARKAAVNKSVSKKVAAIRKAAKKTTAKKTVKVKVVAIPREVKYDGSVYIKTGKASPTEQSALNRLASHKARRRNAIKKKIATKWYIYTEVPQSK